MAHTDIKRYFIRIALAHIHFNIPCWSPASLLSDLFLNITSTIDDACD